MSKVETKAETAQVQQPINPVLNFFRQPEGLLLLGMAVFIAALKMLDAKRGKKGILGKARKAGSSEKHRAMGTAMQQMSMKQRNPVSLYLDRPGTKRPLMLPDMNRGTAIIGSPGMGKTITGFVPLIYSSIDQGFPAIVYDFKYPDLAEQIVGLAARKGYDIHIFAPGYSESKVCNPLDFIDKDTPAIMAAQFSEVLNRNFKKDDGKGEDQFFKAASDALVKGVLMLAKETNSPDLLTCNSLLSLPNLTVRLQNNQQKIKEMTYQAFSTLIASAGSEKTVAGIVASATNNFSSMMIPEVLGCLIGQSNLPIQVTGKTLIILGLDQEKRDVLTPILALILDMMISRNMAFKRDDPLMLFLDECPTLYLPRLVNWLNEFRSKGLCTILGVQNIVQMEDKYGKEKTRAIFGACNTQILYNPRDYESARLFSDGYGQEEVILKERSRSTGKGASTNIADRRQTRSLYSPDEIMRFDAGERIITSPGFRSKGESYLPYRDKAIIRNGMVVSLAFTKTLKQSTDFWDSWRNWAISNNNLPKVDDALLRSRRLAVEAEYPEVKENKKKDAAAKSPQTSPQTSSQTSSAPSSDKDIIEKVRSAGEIAKNLNA
jgi:type IV secretory pathway TraG/TraD family ATPase VirD4